MTEPILPKGCEEHQAKYKDGIWRDYTLTELGWFVHLLVKRSLHRKDYDKREKDLIDARNYLGMMSSKLDFLEEQFREEVAQEQGGNG